MNAETHPRLGDRATAFEAEGDDQVVQYGSPSALAIISLLLGLAAPLCFVAPLLMAIPIFGAALALVALRHITASEGTLIGRRAAMFGLALSVAAGVAAVARTQVIQSMRSDQAKAVVRKWVELIQAGQDEPAFRLTYRGAAPEAATPPPIPGEPVDTVDPLQRFKDDPAIKAIRAAGEEGVRWVEDVAYIPQPRGEFVVQQVYQVSPAPVWASDEPVDVILNLQLSRAGGAQAPRWLIGSYALDDASGDEAGSE